MRRRFPILVLLACAALFAFGVGQLFELRFASGDVYPPYSSLRADPLGTMALYESLGKMPGLTVRRDFSTSNRLPEEPKTAYFHLAAGRSEWRWLDADDFHEIKNFVAAGGRLVITFFPQTGSSYDYRGDEQETNSVESGQLKPKAKPAKKTHPALHAGEVNVEEEWGLHPDFAELPQEQGVYQAVPVWNRAGTGLPHSLDWHSGMIFTNSDAAWKTIYARGKDAVVLERPFGRGTVVVAGDSYFLSNEAMTKDRHADFLAWLVGANTQVVFDEAHLGILHSPGIAALMRQYRLHGLAAGLLLLAGLFIWKNSTSLAPPPAEAQREEFVAGKDSASGFINLLRRHISARAVLGVCFAEWKKSASPAGRVSNTRLQRAEAIWAEEQARPAGQRDAVAAYNRISETLGKRKHTL
jgi:hypothetical protein